MQNCAQSCVERLDQAVCHLIETHLKRVLKLVQIIDRDNFVT